MDDYEDLKEKYHLTDDQIADLKHRHEQVKAEVHEVPVIDMHEVNARVIESKFEPINITLSTRKDCAVAVFQMWRYACAHLSIHQVFDMVNRWAYEQSEKEEVMRVIMTELVKRYCPHYTISVVEQDPEYQARLQEHREIAQMVQQINERNMETTMSDEAWGSENMNPEERETPRPRRGESFEQFMRRVKGE